jgi:hypothetical protein
MESEQQATQQVAVTATDGAAPTVRVEPPITLIDAGVIALILGLALWYLYRQFWRKRGACSGCAKGQEGACAVSRSIAKSAQREPSQARVSVDVSRKRSSAS